MPTNQEWLHKLANESPDELKAWFDAEHNDNLAAEKVVSGDAAHSKDGNAHLKAHSKTEPMLSEQSESLSEELDSREKLEADIRASLGFTTKDVFAWLDRQDRITHLECMESCNSCVYRVEYNERADEVDMLQRRNDELRTSYDKLKRERDYWREQMLNCVIAACRPGGYTKGVMDYPRDDGYTEPSLLVTDAIESTRGFNADVARLTAERDNLADDLLTCNREREHLRKNLGIALDHAHDICALVDIGD